MATFLAGYGVIQHFGLDPVDWWGYRQMEINAYGTIGQAVGFGMIVGSSLFLPLTSFLQAKSPFRKFVFLLSLLIMALGILYSGSRTPALAALFVSVVGLGAYILKNRNRQALKMAVSFAPGLVIKRLNRLRKPLREMPR